MCRWLRNMEQAKAPRILVNVVNCQLLKFEVGAAAEVGEKRGAREGRRDSFALTSSELSQKFVPETGPSPS